MNLQKGKLYRTNEGTTRFIWSNDPRALESETTNRIIGRIPSSGIVIFLESHIEAEQSEERVWLKVIYRDAIGWIDIWVTNDKILIGLGRGLDFYFQPVNIPE